MVVSLCGHWSRQSRVAALLIPPSSSISSSSASRRRPSTRTSTSSRWLLFSSSAQQQQEEEVEQDDDYNKNNDQPVLLHPNDFYNEKGSFKFPKAMSPSSILEFKNCPQSFFFQYILGIRQPSNLALAKGSMVHSALEKVFDLDPGDRSLDNLQNLFRSVWSDNRSTDQYKMLFEKSPEKERDLESEITWGKEALKLLENYFELEDPRKVKSPAQREVWVTAHLTTNPWLGFTAPPPVHDHPNAGGADHESDPDTFFVRGIVDRLDYIRDFNENQVVLRLCDYKTGKAPNLKYAPSTNERIREESFYQLFIYALLLREKQKLKKGVGVDLRFLRLMFLTSNSNGNDIGKAQWLDYDLGATQDQRDAKLHQIHQDLAQIWLQVKQLVETNDPTVWKPCSRKFCYCHKCRPKFVPGTLAEPEQEYF
eukprot:CAMPEP_0198148080 /NCGR_PEP_ID=MMETSP1443-20131203/39649_1 /TAXON_ID=186043 /ORGANISM="Entomoneis sp., Strain CCMP2396" /LENGTH=423 /DNA_ID=CAMNT_0043812665 /DNA_START=247 /DNA_END=1518 /DNA_ORIENTATION=-